MSPAGRRTQVPLLLLAEAWPALAPVLGPLLLPLREIVASERIVRRRAVALPPDPVP